MCGHVSQDVLLVHPLALSSTPQSLMYMVCDGHCGPEAANFVSAHFLPTLNAKLPAKLPNFNNAAGARR
jgi:serine/threonine protein phosphatase PrpC